jgi:hypothetical protein
MTQAAITSGGPTQDFNITGIDQPKAALYQMTSGLTVGTIASVARHSVGMTDGTTERVCYCMWENGGSTTATHDTGTRADTATVAVMSGTADQSIVGEGDHNQWNTTGSTLNWGDLMPSAFQVLPAYFFGTDLTAAVAEFSGSATQDVEEEETFGFRPDVLIAISYHSTGFTADFGGNEARMSIGVAVNDQGTIRQWCYSHRSSDRPASTENTSELRDDCIAAQLTISSGSGSRGARLEVTGFTPTGFKWTTRASAFGLSVAVLGLSLPHRRVWAGVPTWSSDFTTSGNKSTTSPGFKPMAHINLATALDTINTINNANLASHYCLGITSASEANCAVVQVEDGAGTSNTRSGIVAQTAKVVDNSGGSVYDLTHVSFDTSGFTVNLPVAIASHRLAPFLVFGEDLPDADYLRRYEHTRAPNTSLRM